MSEDSASPLRWRKSTFSNGSGCVEAVALPGGYVAVRDSMNVDRGKLVYNAHEWVSFLAGVRAGEFDDLVPTPPGG